MYTRERDTHYPTTWNDITNYNFRMAFSRNEEDSTQPENVAEWLLKLILGYALPILFNTK